jgi:hypothetical protein
MHSLMQWLLLLLALGSQSATEALDRRLYEADAADVSQTWCASRCSRHLKRSNVHGSVQQPMLHPSSRIGHWLQSQNITRLGCKVVLTSSS